MGVIYFAYPLLLCSQVLFEKVHWGPIEVEQEIDVRGFFAVQWKSSARKDIRCVVFHLKEFASSRFGTESTE